MNMKWFELWFADKQSVIETMIRNMNDDLNAGYDYFGNCIKRQRAEIDEYKKQFDTEIDRLKEMDDKKAERWCYLDLKKRGAIA